MIPFVFHNQYPIAINKSLHIEFSKNVCMYGLMRGVVIDALGNTHEKIMTTEEVTVVLHDNIPIQFNGHPPRYVALFEPDLIIQPENAISLWRQWLDGERKKGPSQFNGGFQKAYQERYERMSSINNWTSDFLDSFTQTEIFIEPVNLRY